MNTGSIKKMDSVNIKTDDQLVSGYLDGDKDCMQILVNKHQEYVSSYIYKMTKDKHLTDDVGQETYIKIVKNLEAGKYEGNGKFLAWVLRIAHNLIIDNYRKNGRGIILNGNELEDISDALQTHNIDDEVHTNEYYQNVLKLIVEELPEDQREIINLRYYAKLSFKEIAKQSDISINTALGRMRYAIINLRKKIISNKDQYVDLSA